MFETSDITRDEYTEMVFDMNCFGEPVNPETAADVEEGVKRAMELEERPIFLKGLAARLNQLGVECTVSDEKLMMSEVKKRFRAVLGKDCPKAVQNWIKGTTPGITNRANNYDLCYALEMDFQQTAVFFQKHFLTQPFNCKSRIDAVYLYCLYHKKSYTSVTDLLEVSEKFPLQEQAHTSTAQIFSAILSIDDDEAFLKYIFAHCYSNEQQFQLARELINAEIKHLKEDIIRYKSKDILSENRLNSMTVTELLGYNYQLDGSSKAQHKLPKRFTESLPNDVTLGRIINGESVSYELLRKTLMLLRFNNFYSQAINDDRDKIAQNLMDFYEELDRTLISCGFAQMYVRHPFDCLLLYCANSYDPIDTLYCVNNYGRN